MRAKVMKICRFVVDASTEAKSSLRGGMSSRHFSHASISLKSGTLVRERHMYKSAKPFHASLNRPGEIHPRKLEKFRRQKLLHPPTRTISLMVEDLFVSLDNTSKNWVPNASGNPKNTRSSPWPQYFENYWSYKNQVVSNFKKIALNVTCSTLNID